VVLCDTLGPIVTFTFVPRGPIGESNGEENVSSALSVDLWKEQSDGLLRASFLSEEAVVDLPETVLSRTVNVLFGTGAPLGLVVSDADHIVDVLALEVYLRQQSHVVAW